jgi:hypothetical protein
MTEEKQKEPHGKELLWKLFNEDKLQDEMLEGLFLKYKNQEGLVWSTFKENKEKQKELIYVDMNEFHVTSKRILHQKLKDKIKKLRMRRGVKT